MLPVEITLNNIIIYMSLFTNSNHTQSVRNTDIPNDLHARQIPNGLNFASHYIPDCTRDLKLVSFAITFTTLCNEEPSDFDLEN